ncbi:MAG: ATP synthase F1 subunit delta [Oscillospiraceae bacterium]|jgi:F-type H+-transporting ATPase subunit delta|nr:ATP synthase F1 subunit delta [Oscillospiraceae bacterium]
MAVKAEEVYADALFSLTEEDLGKDALGKVMNDLSLSLDKIAETENFMEFLTSPIIDKGDKLDVIDKTFGQLSGYSPTVLRFLKLLVVKRRVGLLNNIVKSFRGKYNDCYRITDVTVTLPYAANDATLRKIREKAEKLTGKAVSLNVVIDTEIIGGLILDYDGKRLDGSVRAKLDALSNKISDIIV